jgi:hypothetical protein
MQHTDPSQPDRVRGGNIEIEIERECHFVFFFFFRGIYIEDTDEGIGNVNQKIKNKIK